MTEFLITLLGAESYCLHADFINYLTNLLRPHEEAVKIFVGAEPNTSPVIITTPRPVVMKITTQRPACK